MTKRRESNLDALQRKFEKIEREYERTPEAAINKRAKLMRRAEKIQYELDKASK